MRFKEIVEDRSRMYYPYWIFGLRGYLPPWSLDWVSWVPYSKGGGIGRVPLDFHDVGSC